jgi:DNA-binding transcriptional regulator LsrR (DeoR family)
MSVLETLPPPAWVSGKDFPSATDRARLLFYLRLAALYHNERGSLVDLAHDMGFSRSTLHMALKRGHLPTDIAVKIENKIGRELFPIQLLRPDLTPNPIQE